MIVVGIELCTPALLYLVIEVFVILVGMYMAFSVIHKCRADNKPENPKNKRKTCDRVSSPSQIAMGFSLLILFDLFWVWLINKLCRKGYQRTGWFLAIVALFRSFM